MNTNEWILDTNTVYEFTINFNDDFQTKGIDRYKSARKFLRNILDDGLYKYKLIPEITMPQYGDRYTNVMPRIHFHGVLMFKSNKQVLHWLLKGALIIAKIGRYQFNEYRDEYWPDYCLKNEYLFSGLEPYELESEYDMKWPKYKPNTNSKLKSSEGTEMVMDSPDATASTL